MHELQPDAAPRSIHLDTRHSQSDGGKEVKLIIVAPLVGGLRFGGCPALAAALFLFNDRNCGGNEFDATISAVGPGVQLSVVVEVVLSVELVFATELA